MRKQLFLLFSLLCMIVQGIWAQTPVASDSELRSAITNGANITVTADIDLSNSTLSIAEGTTVTIDLGGHTLDRKLTQRGEGGGQVITVRSGATLNLSNGTLKGGWGGAGGALVNEGGTVTLTDVMITDNVADDRGGGICNRENGTLTMTDVTITNNHSNDQSGAKGGGGLFNEEGATATLTNVTITGNEATVCGGGGICNFGTLTIDGGTISGNTASTYGAGIWQEGTLNVQGTNIISDNWKPNGLRSNLYLKNGTVINITGSLADSKVFVDMETLGTFTSGYSDYNEGHPAGFFTADKQSVTGMRLVGGEAQLNNAIPEGGVYYVERSWNETTKRVEATFHTLEENQYITLTGSDDNEYLDPGWYVVKGSDVVYDDMLYMNGGGEYHLILCDGASLKAWFFIVNSPSVLHIYGQADDTGKMTNMYSPSFSIHRYYAGLGADADEANGTIVIHGGDINVHGGDASPGIGNNSYTDPGGAITIYGGTVHAEGDSEHGSDGGGGGAGIGGGWNNDCGIVNIYGGSVYATGRGNTSGGAGIGSGSYAHNSGTITIYGGYVEATGDVGSAGIGGGKGTNGADVTIHGGTVKAKCDKYKGPGIGAGQNDDNRITYTGTLTVTGGRVYAYGHERGAGIGGGWNTNGCDVTISGGYVYAEGGKWAAGIGSGCEYIGSERHGGTLTVTGGYVEAHGGEDGAGIGGGEDADGGTVNISGGEVRAYGTDKGAGIGGSESGTGANVTITGGIVIAESGGDQRAIGAGSDSDNHGSLTFADNLGVFVTTDLNRSVKANRVIDCRNFKYVRINQCAHGGATATIVDGEKHGITCNWCYTTDEIHTFGDYGECAVCGLISLRDHSANSDIIEHWDGSTDKSVTLSGRTLWKDGDWNTLCLPFNVTIADSPLAGATVKELDTEGIYDTDKKTSFDSETGKLYLYFKDATAITAGVPYLVKWASGTDIASPVFTGVTIDKDLNDITSDDGKVTFRGNYDPVPLTGGDKSSLFLGTSNTLYYPAQDKTINAFRAYFTVDLGEAQEVKAFVLNLDNDNTTQVTTPLALRRGVGGEAWYTLDGRKLQDEPTAKGIYINHGRKVVIK